MEIIDCEEKIDEMMTRCQNSPDQNVCSNKMFKMKNLYNLHSMLKNPGYIETQSGLFICYNCQENNFKEMYKTQLVNLNSSLESFSIKIQDEFSLLSKRVIFDSFKKFLLNDEKIKDASYRICPECETSVNAKDFLHHHKNCGQCSFRFWGGRKCKKMNCPKKCHSLVKDDSFKPLQCNGFNSCSHKLLSFDMLRNSFGSKIFFLISDDINCSLSSLLAYLVKQTKDIFIKDCECAQKLLKCNCWIRAYQSTTSLTNLAGERRPNLIRNIKKKFYCIFLVENNENMPETFDPAYHSRPSNLTFIFIIPPQLQNIYLSKFKHSVIIPVGPRE